MSDLALHYAAKSGSLRGAMVCLRTTLKVAVDLYGRGDDDLSRMTREALAEAERALAEHTQEPQPCA